MARGARARPARVIRALARIIRKRWQSSLAGRQQDQVWGDVATRTATIAVTADETVTCTFTNAGPLAYAARYDHQVFFGSELIPITQVAENYQLTVTGSRASQRVEQICVLDDWLAQWRGQSGTNTGFQISRFPDFSDDLFLLEYTPFVQPKFGGATRRIPICQSGPTFSVSDGLYMVATRDNLFSLLITKLSHGARFQVYLEACPNTPVEIVMLNDSTSLKKKVPIGDLDEPKDGLLSCP